MICIIVPISLLHILMLKLKRVSQGLLALSGTGFAYQYNRDEGTRRSLLFWKEAFPIYLHYRYVEITTKHESELEQTKAFNALHDRYAPKVGSLVLQLRGFYLKTAQFMSTVDYFIPKQYLHFCKQMQNEVPTQFAPGEAEEVVKQSLKLDSLDQVFSSFNPIPIGSASIGQVHVATLKSTGEQVAVKIMGKGVEPRFRADIQTQLDFCRLAMPQFVDSMLEIQNQFETEFDYRLEAENLLKVRRNLLPKFEKEIYVPRPYLDLCTKEVLTMELLSGPTLIKGILQNFSDYAESNGSTLEVLQREQEELMRRPDFKFRDVREDSRRIKMYDAYCKVYDWCRQTPVWLYNHSGLPGKLEYPKKSVQLLNLGEIIQLLCKVHAHEVLVDGEFSCDSHPGNVLLMDDGRLGLIDFGQFKTIPLSTRLTLARVVVGLANGDEADVVKTMKLAGARSKFGNAQVQFRITAFWYDRNTPEIMGKGKNPQQFLTEMEELDPQESIPSDLIMPGRVAVMMRGIGNAFGLRLSIAELWEPVARQVLRENGVEYDPKKTKVI